MFFFSGNHTAVYVTLAVFLAGLSTVLSKPSGKSEWWLDPCHTQTQIRHPRSAKERQLCYSINDIKGLKKKLAEIYPNVSFN